MTMTTPAPPSAEATSLPLELTPELAELRRRAATFVEQIVIPLEQEAELRNGRLPAESIELVKREGIAARLNGGLHSPEYGGQGWSRMEWALVEEQFGRSTNGIYWHVPNAYNVWDNASEAQRERYLRRRSPASSRTHTRSPRRAPAPTPRGSRRPPTRPTPAIGSTARSGS